MPKSEYSADGHNVIIHHYGVDDYRDLSFWIDRKSGFMSHICKHIDLVPREFRPDTAVDESSISIDQAERIISWMVDNDLLFCPNCNRFYDQENSRSTRFAGHQCAECATAEATCVDGGDHSYECINPHQKHNARVATKYRCTTDGCDHVKKTTPTG